MLLSSLNLAYNRLSDVPGWFGNLSSLTNLYLDGNLLSGLPASLGNLTSLTSLHLADCKSLLHNLHQFPSIPDSLGNLTSLTSLDLRRNNRTKFPEWLGDLTSLISLDLSRNQLTEVPAWVCSLPALSSLNLANNLITELPIWLAGLLTSGLGIDLDGNRLADPLEKLQRRGADALATYLSSLEDAVKQYEAKLLLVGEGNVGKTSLVASLKGAPFVERRSTTHGIEISPITLSHPNLSSDMTLRTWDFGGQQVYRVTHQFFFTRRALYAIVWHAREGSEQNLVEDWLRLIRLRVGSDARAIVIATHCEERLPDLDYSDLEQSFPNILTGNFEVDNRTGAGIRELRNAIAREAAQLPLMGQLLSPRWVAARDDILARGQSEPHISYEQFVKICNAHGVTGKETITLAQLLHDLGHIIYYAEDEGLRDIVVLNPEWLTKAISYVLEDKTTKDAAGVLEHARLRQLWQDRSDGWGYPARYHPYFLRLMEKFDVSYRLDGDQPRSLIAQLVPHKRPDLPWQTDTKLPNRIRRLALVCELSEPSPGIIPWLTVRHHRASTNRHWRRGVFLRHPTEAYKSEALLELLRPDKLSIEVRAPAPDLYFHVIRDSVEDLISSRWPGLTYQLLIPCPHQENDGSQCPGRFPLDGLLRLRESDLTVVPCMQCAQQHEISLLLTGFGVSPQPLMVEVKQMHEQLTRVETGVARIEGQAAETAVAVRRVLRVVSTEVTDCPSLFTLAKAWPSKGNRMRIYQHHYELTLWCEHPGYWHPWAKATYKIDPPKDWFSTVAPYAVLIFRTLQLIVPLVGSIAVALLPRERIESAEARLEVMKTLVEDLPSVLPELGDGGPEQTTNKLTSAEADALRALRAIIFKSDPLRSFGGLKRVVAPSGDFLWVCADHYAEYDPGLPVLP